MSDDGARALEHQRHAELPGELPRRFQAIGLNLGDGCRRQPRHFSRMRREHQRAPLGEFGQQHRLGGENVQCIGVDDGGNLCCRKQAGGELGGFGTLPQAGAERQNRFARQQRIEQFGFAVFRCDLAFAAGQKRPGHQLRREGGDDVQRRGGNRGGDQPSAGAQRGQRRHCWSACLAAARAECSAHHQHMAEVALVGRRQPWRLRQIERRAGPLQPQCGDDCFVGRADGRDDDRLIPAAGQIPKNMRRLGRGKGNDGVGGEDRAGKIRGGFVGRPARGQVYGQNRRVGYYLLAAGTQPRERGQRQPAHRRLEACSQQRVHDQVGVQRVVVPGQFLLVCDYVHAAVRGMVELAPGHGGIAGDFFWRAQQKRCHAEAGFGQQPGRHHAVAAVVAASAEHGNPARGRELFSREGGHRRGGRAHQVDRRHPIPLAGKAIAGLHLDSGEYAHRLHGTKETAKAAVRAGFFRRLATSAAGLEAWRGCWRG